MYKFKFDPPQEHRRSLQQPKSEHIAIFNILDKCTQILRDDRLWLRNQIKNNNSEVLDIFKQFPRSSQFANLQVKLRKYVQTIKGKIKQQQLSKFKETLAHQQNPSFMAEQNHERRPFDRNVQRKRSNQSSSKSNLKTNNSVELNKTSTWKMGRSQDHFEPSRMQMSSSLRHFQQLIRHKYNQDIIQERQSQNVTSARLGRQENENSQVPPLQEQNFSSIQNRAAGKTTNHFFAKDNFAYDYKNKAEAKNTMNKEQQNQRKWSFQKKAKQALYAYKDEEQKQKEIEQINVGVSKTNQEEWNMDDRDESIFDKHFTESEKASAKNQYSDVNSLNNINQFKNANASRTDHYESTDLQKIKNDHNSFNVFQLVQSNFSSVNSKEAPVAPKATTQIESDRKSDQNLFTPMDLLNQCRNFLKNRQNSMKKSMFSNHLSDTLKHEELKESAISGSKMEESIQCLFSRNNFKESSYLKEKSEEVKKEEQSIYTFPQIKEEKTDKKAELAKPIDSTDFHYQSFETFANSDTKKQIEKALTPPQFGVALKMQAQKQTVPPIPKNFTIEGFLQQIMEITEMQPSISASMLSQYINCNQNKTFLNYALSTFLKSNNEICLTSLAQAFNKVYFAQYGKDYPHSDKTVNSVYDLLDIEPKGYITREDIDSFLSQIQEAEVQNFDEVEQQLIRLFEGADFTNEQRLTYWHFYLVKNSEQFERVSQLLGEFEFQIERQA